MGERDFVTPRCIMQSNQTKNVPQHDCDRRRGENEQDASHPRLNRPTDQLASLPPSLPSWARISSSLVGRTRPATQEGHGGTSTTEWTEYGCGSGCRRETNCMEALTRGRGRRRRGRPAIPFSDRLQSTRATPPRLSLQPKKFPLFVCKVAPRAAPYERK